MSPLFSVFILYKKVGALMGVISFANWISTAPQWIQSCPESLQNLLFQLYQTFIYQDRWKFFTDGLKITFIVTVGALILGVIIGLIIAIIRTSHDNKINKKPPRNLGGFLERNYEKHVRSYLLFILLCLERR